MDNELINGGKNNTETDNVETSVVNALQYADKAVKSKTRLIQNISVYAFSALILLGIITCIIVDIAMSATLTWSLIPIGACIFAWLSFIPAIKYGINGILFSLIMFSVFTIPFLLVLSNLVDSGGMLIPIGVRTSIIGIVFLWIVYGLFKLLRSRILTAVAITLLLAIPLNISIDFVLRKFISGPLFDVWDAMSYSIIVVAAIILFIVSHNKQKKKVS